MTTVTETQTTHDVGLINIRQNPASQVPLEPSPSPPLTEASGLSKATILKLLSAGFSFFVAGVNDGSIGALLPYIIREYQISNAIVSAM